MRHIWTTLRRNIIPVIDDGNVDFESVKISNSKIPTKVTNKKYVIITLWEELHKIKA